MIWMVEGHWNGSRATQDIPSGHSVNVLTTLFT